MRLLLFIVVISGIFAASPSVAPASAQAAPLPADDAFQLHVSSRPDGSLTFVWTIADGYYLYRDYITAKRADGAELRVETLPGQRKDDPTFGVTEVYFRNASATVTAAGTAPIELTYQGCQENGICYVPQTKLIDPVTVAASNPTGQAGSPDLPTGRAGALPLAGRPEAQATAAARVSSTTAASVATSFDLAADDGVVSSLRSQGGALLVIAGFLAFGLLLAFTPCVFPIYPILAGVLAREGGRLTPRRGFALSSIYVLSFASSFSLLGAVAGWSGQSLQMALQSPVTTAAVAFIFAVLALAMFGLFELQLPASWTNWIAQRTGGKNISKRSVAILGFSSALIVGPCVTAPLAGALIYIAQTGDMALGAAALFALGIGKGIPLIILGTMGGSVFPRSGAWMENVKRVFGFGFLATAIWMATPLLPAGLDLVLWAALLIGAGTWALSSEHTGSNWRVVARASGTMALAYGVILMIGAASGATDPLKPLAALASRSAPAAKAELEFATVASTKELQAQLTSAKGAEPTLVYFTADWCITCRTIERSVLTDGGVRRSLDGYRLLKADLSDLNPDNTDLMQQLKIAGPPTMLFFDRTARETARTRLVGEVTIERLSRSAGLAAAH